MFRDYDRDMRKLQQDVRSMFDDMNATMDDLRKETEKVVAEARRMKQAFTWSAWESWTVGIMPKRVNRRWYFKGDVIYRRERMQGLTGSNIFQYGDEFDVLKEQYND